MKKAILVLVLAAVFAACGNGNTPTTTTVDSTKVDTTKTTTPAIDTTLNPGQSGGGKTKQPLK